MTIEKSVIDAARQPMQECSPRATRRLDVLVCGRARSSVGSERWHIGPRLNGFNLSDHGTAGGYGLESANECVDINKRKDLLNPTLRPGSVQAVQYEPAMVREMGGCLKQSGDRVQYIARQFTVKPYTVSPEEHAESDYSSPTREQLRN